MVGIVADNTVVHTGENSPEYVALLLTREIANIEGRALYSQGDKPVDRAWNLDTYAECLHAVGGNREFPNRGEVRRGR